MRTKQKHLLPYHDTSNKFKRKIYKKSYALTFWWYDQHKNFDPNKIKIDVKP